MSNVLIPAASIPEIFHVTSDLEIWSTEDAVNALNCPIRRGLANTPKEIPMVVWPVDCKVRAITLRRIMTMAEVYSLYPNIVTPAELFAFGAKFPKEQQNGMIFTVGLDLDLLFGVFLDFYAGARTVCVVELHPRDERPATSRVLVRELPLAA